MAVDDLPPGSRQIDAAGHLGQRGGPQLGTILLLELERHHAGSGQGQAQRGGADRHQTGHPAQVARESPEYPRPRVAGDAGGDPHGSEVGDGARAPGADQRAGHAREGEQADAARGGDQHLRPQEDGEPAPHQSRRLGPRPLGDGKQAPHHQGGAAEDGGAGQQATLLDQADQGQVGLACREVLGEQ